MVEPVFDFTPRDEAAVAFADAVKERLVGPRKRRKFTVGLQDQLNGRLKLFAWQNKLTLTEVMNEVLSAVTANYSSSSKPDLKRVNPAFARSFSAAIRSAREKRVTGPHWHTFDVSDLVLDNMHRVAANLRSDMSVIAAVALDVFLTRAVTPSEKSESAAA